MPPSAGCLGLNGSSELCPSPLIPRRMGGGKGKVLCFKFRGIGNFPKRVLPRKIVSGTGWTITPRNLGSVFWVPLGQLGEGDTRSLSAPPPPPEAGGEVRIRIPRFVIRTGPKGDPGSKGVAALPSGLKDSTGLPYLPLPEGGGE